ncbi:hypothetical protein DTO006G1_2656 [Penicillium roqueforti]|nr:hypothetical protein CBS147337_2674 [Penicillium roqueforti]KAI2690222.1 hypothetical protein CBS147355_673 [Penicillium roqueforti]KAI2695210.1 hypothetical protein CBS147372_9338 [Penicillium roqueforti]KAI2729620.1 hypothetical protein CBS147354_1005 [Penicillium roqueforti]KAI2762719.1 hypothetical protein DTO006G1_2656 [Penicillium roqueforti]
MAANLGERSLADVHEEGLDEILSVLARVFPSHSSHDPHSLGVPILDTLLEVFAPKALPMSGAMNDGQLQPSSEPIEQQILEDEEMLLHSECPAGQGSRPDEIHGAQDIEPLANVLPSDPTGSKKQQVPVLEISSSLSASGKSQLLYYLTALAILPRRYGDISVSGKEAAVVFIDTDHRFDAERLRTVARDIVLKQRGTSESGLGAQSGGMPDHHLESLLVSSLQHVHVFRPQSSSALLATIRTLESYLFDLSRHRSASRPLQMIAIDSATAFIKQDRLRDEVARTEEIGRPQAEIDAEREQKKSFYLSDLYTELVSELKGLQSQFQCAVVYTTTVSGGRASGAGYYDQPQARTPPLRPALPAPWGTFATLRLIVHRSSVRPFPPDMAAHAAVKDAPSRQSVVQQGKISAWVNTWGHNEWPRRIVEAIEANNGGSFSFYIRDSGVEMTDPHH